MKINFFKQKLIGVTLICFIFVLTATPVLAVESITDKVQTGIKNLSKAAYGDVSFKGDTLVDPIVIIINRVLTFTGVVFLAILIYGGYLWMMARGNEEQIEKAKKIIKDAIIGIILIVLARLIIEFVIYQVGKSVPLDLEPIEPIG